MWNEDGFPVMKCGSCVVTALICTFVFAFPPPASAQVRCTMPNGLVIKQQLAKKCPVDAVKSENLDGSPVLVGGQLPQQAPQAAHKNKGLLRVSEAEWGGGWPLTIPEGKLQCYQFPGMDKRLAAVTFEAQGAIFHVNGTAAAFASKYGWRELGPIWRANLQIPGAKMSIGALIQKGLELCGL